MQDEAQSLNKLNVLIDLLYNTSRAGEGQLKVPSNSIIFMMKVMRSDEHEYGTFLLPTLELNQQYLQTKDKAASMREMIFTRINGSSAFVVLSNKEKVMRTGLISDCTPLRYIRDIY